MRCLWLIPCFTLWAAPGRAQTTSPKECDPGDPQRCAMPLQQGQAAPFPGQLLTPKLAIDLGQKANYCEDRLKLEVAREREIAAIQKELDTKLIAIEKQVALDKVAALQKALDEQKGFEPPPPWYTHPAIVSVVAALATTGVFVLAVKTVEWTSR